MRIIDHYLFDIEGDEFLLRSHDYFEKKLKVTKYPLLPLDKIYVLEENESLNEMYNMLIDDITYLIINVKLSKKQVIYTYKVEYDSPQLKLFWKFFYNKIDRKNRIKIIPYVKNNKSIIMKNNKPVMIGKKINVDFDRFDNILQIDIVLNNNFLIRKVLKYILSKDKSVYVGLTIETHPNDYCEEELLCIFGLNNLRELKDIDYKLI